MILYFAVDLHTCVFTFNAMSISLQETLKTRKEVAYKLIESHGNVEDMAKFAALMSGENFAKCSSVFFLLIARNSRTSTRTVYNCAFHFFFMW